ncbi:PIR Superfamily Protein [Plasmodium ovale wallikeri]|uniref:PIR Superfamily Protein n=2 Tax=Plasmodium ovale TaxID=36330 RepID=A0A1A8XBX4_PLAOA|nr:PIR Superfamily Protein [Plasmodium ovale curtisi]SBT52201.1 PIR Superfamily Protein [Plasmodium ovale wallikeri]
MKEIGKSEKYDSFEDYSFNYGIYNQIQSEIGGDFDSFPETVLGEKTEHSFRITMDCLRLRKYLMHFGSNDKCQNKNCCQYINYILNGRVRDDYNSKSSIFDIYKSYMNHNSNNEIKNLCMSEIKDMGTDIYEKSKNLYNLYKICELFISNKRLTPLCSYAKPCSTIYNKIISEYPDIDDTKFCKVLKDFKRVFEEKVNLSTSICNSEIQNLFLLSVTCNHDEEKADGSFAFSGSRSGMLDTQETYGESSHPPAPQTESDTEEHHILPSSLGATIPITLFSSGISVLLILLSFYKFTPLGNWLKLRIQNFKGISRSNDGEEYEIHQLIPEYDERDSDYNGYNIAYNSL